MLEDNFNFGSTNNPADEAKPEGLMDKGLVCPVFLTWIVIRRFQLSRNLLQFLPISKGRLRLRGFAFFQLFYKPCLTFGRE